MIKIIIGGDVCPINRNESYFKKGDAKSIFNDLLPEFKYADFSIVNLECPLIDKSTPIIKNGPILGIPSKCINGIKNSGIELVNLANNHILDHGWQGIKNTIEVCKKEGVDIIGAGKNQEEAGEIKIYKIKNIRIAILSMSEHEFSITDENSYGANPLDLINFIKKVNQYKNKFDYLIILVHAGLSGYPLPSPNFMRIAHFLVDMGANIIIFQHSHIAGCYEKYKDAYIVYGQGNLIFNYYPNIRSKAWNRGFLIKMSLSLNSNINHSMEIIPFIQSDCGIGAFKMKGEEKRIFIEEIGERSQAIKKLKYVKKKWWEFCESHRNDDYFKLLIGNNRILNFINRKFSFAKLFFYRNHSLMLENLIRCESHRERIETMFLSNRNKWGK